MIFVDVGSIQRYNLKDKLQYGLISSMKKGVALDYDIEEGRIFYSDVTRNAIYSSYITKNEKNVTEVLINIIIYCLLVINVHLTYLDNFNFSPTTSTLMIFC